MSSTLRVTTRGDGRADVWRDHLNRAPAATSCRSFPAATGPPPTRCDEPSGQIQKQRQQFSHKTKRPGSVELRAVVYVAGGLDHVVIVECVQTVGAGARRAHATTSRYMQLS